MHPFIIKCLELLFPPREEALIVRNLSKNDIDRMFQPLNVGEIIALTALKNFEVGALIHEAKFHHNVTAFELLAHLFSLYLDAANCPPDTIVIPLPLAAVRLRERGYNQVIETAKRALTEKRTFVLEINALVRTRNTASQIGLKKADRLKNVENAFIAPHPSLITGRHILLLDDVLTTGATLGAAKAVLLPHQPSSLTCIALAH